MRTRNSISTATLRAMTPRERIAAVADSESVRAVAASFEAPRPSPHLARWRIVAEADDGVVIARAAIHGAPVFIAAQDERFLRGSVGANHGDALRRLFEHACISRPAAVVILGASAGVRLHEANPAEWSLARALRALLDLRSTGVPVLALCVADTFGGASVLACAAERIALLPQVRLGLSGPAVIETAHGRGEVDANDPAAVAALFGAEARVAAGHAELVVDEPGVVRGWIASTIAASVPFAAWVRAMHERLGARLAAVPDDRPPPAGGRRAANAIAQPSAPLDADAAPCDATGWLWRMRDRPVWIARALGAAALGPRAAHGLDAALLAHVAESGVAGPRTLLLLEDSQGHEASRSAESLCVSQYLAQHAAVVALLRSEGVRVVGMLTGIGHSAAFFVGALQAQRVYALTGARVAAMEPAAIARVLGLPGKEIATLAEGDRLLGQPVRHFASWGGIAEIVGDAGAERVLALAARDLR